VELAHFATYRKKARRYFPMVTIFFTNWRSPIRIMAMRPL
jgi:hypothetical protein